MRPDFAAPIVDSLAKGTVVKSYAVDGAWVRFLVTRKDGSVAIGYANASDLEMIKEGDEDEAGVWAPGEMPDKAFRGKGHIVRIFGGFGMLGGGDLPTAARNRFTAEINLIEASGEKALSQINPAFRSRLSFGGEYLYPLTPRFSLGLGIYAAYGKALGSGIFSWSHRVSNRIRAEPNLQTTAYFATASLLLPSDKRSAIRFSGGPMFVTARFSYHGTTPQRMYKMDFAQEATASGFGIQGGVALEININRRSAFYVELMGRAGLIRGFHGTQVTTIDRSATAGTTDVETMTGPLYVVETGGRTLLVILSDPKLAPGPFKEAVYDLLGFDARLGYQIRF